MAIFGWNRGTERAVQTFASNFEADGEGGYVYFGDGERGGYAVSAEERGLLIERYRQILGRANRRAVLWSLAAIAIGIGAAFATDERVMPYIIYPAVALSALVAIWQVRGIGRTVMDAIPPRAPVRAPRSATLRRTATFRARIWRPLFGGAVAIVVLLAPFLRWPPVSWTDRLADLAALTIVVGALVSVMLFVRDRNG